MTTAWRLTGVSAVGDAHLDVGAPCEDAHRVRALASGEVVASVADGTSTAGAGGAGAAVAAEIGLQVLALRIHDEGPPATAAGWTRLLSETVHEVDARLRGVAAAMFPGEHRGGDRLRTTLAIAAIAPPWVAAAVVGDALLIGRRGTERTLHVLMTPWPANRATDLPATLPSKGDGLETRCVAVRDADLDAVLMATDGLAEVLLDHPGTPREQPHGEVVAPLVDHLRLGRDPHELADALLTHGRMRAQTRDDRTLVVATKPAPPAPVPTAEPTEAGVA